MRFIDTNIFLRYLTKDDPVKAAACYALFQRLEQGSEQATTSETIIAEVVYVLSARSHYGLGGTEIRARLTPLLVLRGLRIAHKRTYLRALDLYATYAALDFEDALTISHMERTGITDLYSYDTDFDQVPSVIRRDPAP
ncbi:MAG TPA: PIN domain-containing protein [Chloroflexota bacterium]|nr:PIN domain-containing protein [Chloroflexota bacterium]